ncbi:hypothetical protein Tco_0702087 [Tanacetum coccineum]|uniref:Uncharacterized protein n=1 Tax=Tanacetum coccineum TaxID=301880 RepID=A0ABQ4XVW1_9ASTR
MDCRLLDVSGYDLSSFGVIGMELCETISRLGDVGLVIGCTSLSCFGVDDFGHVFVDLYESGSYIRVGKSFAEETHDFLSSYILTLINGNACDCEGLYVDWLGKVSVLLDTSLGSDHVLMKELLQKCLSLDPVARPHARACGITIPRHTRSSFLPLASVPLMFASLTNQSIDISPVSLRITFHAGLTTTWRFLEFFLFSIDTRGESDRQAVRPPTEASLKEKVLLMVVVTKGEEDEENVRFFAVRGEEEDSTEEASSASPLRTVAPNPSFLLKVVTMLEMTYLDGELWSSRRHGPKLLTEKVEDHHADEDLTDCDSRDRADGAESSRPGSVYILSGTFRPDGISNCGHCLRNCRQLVSTRDGLFTLCSNLYTSLSTDINSVGEACGCAEKLVNAERERDELRAVNADQASHIKELEAELARKDSALVFSNRISNERAVENERLVSKLGYLEKEKIDSIRKLLPTVVRRLLNSHEYKESLSIPFNLAIQAGWAKGLAVKRSERDLMNVLREVQGFDPHSDTRMTVEYDKLFTKTYPYVEKISGLPRRTVQELLKMYHAPPPQDAPTKVNPSSLAPDSSKSAPTRG